LRDWAVTVGGGVADVPQVLADCGFTCDCREKIQTEFDIVFSDDEATPHFIVRHECLQFTSHRSADCVS
jgi:hypothetical protein